MTLEITPINLGNAVLNVNCYLVKTPDGYVLIDTGFSRNRSALEKELVRKGCKNGNLKLIILTHGDSDHAGNCAYLRDKYGAKAAIHRDESQVVEHGDMSLSRKSGNRLTRLVLSFFGLGKSDRFKPDICVDGGYDFSADGFHARVLHVPGHSVGSIAVLTAEGDLFCGDLLVNAQKPVKNSLVDDPAEMDASIQMLKSLKINTVYPGHGKPFPMEMFTNDKPDMNGEKESST
jgi:hydroxyacylglutathione hydrolase